MSPASAGALLIAIAVFAPFVGWNAEHGWATFFKQLGRAPPHGFEPYYIFEFLAAQIRLMNPFVFAALAAAVAAVPGARGPRPARATRRGASFSARSPPRRSISLLHALHDRVQGNWLAPLFPRLRHPLPPTGSPEARRNGVGRASREPSPRAHSGPLPSVSLVMALVFVQADDR